MSNHKKIVLVEDDQLLANLIKDFLTKYEFEVSIIADGYQAVDEIVKVQPDIVILDVMLPGQSGMEVCRQIRPVYNGIILMQTALGDDIDQMMGLELGADDYVIKQVQPRLLLSRIRALLRRTVPLVGNAESTEKIELDNLSINVSLRQVMLNSENVDLTTSEFELLYLLARTPGEAVSRETMTQQLKGYEHDGLDRSLDRRISRLRRKLMDDIDNPQLIKTVRGKGYQLCKSQR